MDWFSHVEQLTLQAPSELQQPGALVPIPDIDSACFLHAVAIECPDNMNQSVVSCSHCSRQT